MSREKLFRDMIYHSALKEEYCYNYFYEKSGFDLCGFIPTVLSEKFFKLERLEEVKVVTR